MEKVKKVKSEEKKETIVSNKLVAQNDYQNLLHELKSIIEKGKSNVYKAVDNNLVETRWQIGERIVREELKYQDRADYGEYLLKNLAIDLNTARPRLSEIIRFYKCYSIVRTLCEQLSWRHYVLLITIVNQKERKFYEQKIVANSWSVRELARQIKSHLYQKTDSKEIEEMFKTKLPAIIDIKNIFKPDYDFNFLEIAPNHLETELEAKIVHNIDSFLKELGGDFSFLGRQVPILIDGEKHFIDLVLYHRGIPCIVLVDLKSDKLDSRDIGQMNKYIGYYRNNKQYVFEEDAIGLIICKEAGREEVVYALDGLEERIFVSIYKTKLPSEEKIKRVMREL
ncbi:MAG: PDDEXK nuclease domain-containing protein [Patescibacteria group bacterium]